MEQDSINRLQLLHPAIRAEAIQAYNEAVKATPAGVHPYITETLRTFEKQQEYYDQGRTKPGPIITNAKPGTSYHQYGLAIDFCLLVNGKMVWEVNKDWMTVVNIFKAHGFSWGGDFQSLKDYPHLEKTFAHNWRDLLAIYNAGRKDFNGYVELNMS